MNYSLNQIRIVLVGRTGNGKSATGNSILHSRTAFHSIQSGQSITKSCEVKTAQYTDSTGRQKEILVADTPGFFDTDENTNNGIVEQKIASQIFTLTTPGVHAFLIILRIGRFSPEEKNTVDFIRKIFGENAAKYCILIFTHEDQLEEGQSLENFISSSRALQELVNICGNRKFTINNKSSGHFLERKTQQLLDMIQEMVHNNQGTYYTNDEYKRIEKQRKDEEEQIKQKKDAEKKAEEEKLKAKVKQEFEEHQRDLNAVRSARIETRTTEIGRNVVPIMSRERTRKSGLAGVFSHNGSGYNYYDAVVGNTTTITYREEQREIKALNCGKEEIGSWRIVREWTQ